MSRIGASQSPEVTTVAVEIHGRDRFDISREILRLLRSAPDVEVSVCARGQKYFSLTAENLSTIDGHGLVYRMRIEPGREQEIESFTGKRHTNEHTGKRHPIRVSGDERLVGSNSRHWIGEDEVALPFLGEVTLARRAMTSIPHPYTPHIFCDYGDMASHVGSWAHGTYAASLSLGLGKEINEDAVLCRLLPEENLCRESLLGVVADGMGGHGGGQVAAGSIARTFAMANLSESSLISVATEVPFEMQQLYDDVQQRTEPGLASLISPDMGAPFAAVRIFPDHFEAIRAGDCRITHYRRDEANYRCIWSSEDQGEGHYVINPARLVRGVAGTLQIEQETRALTAGDYLVVATDGVWKSLELDEVGRILTEERDTESAEVAIVAAVGVAEAWKRRSDNRGIIVYRHGQ